MREIKFQILIEVSNEDFTKKVVEHYTTLDRLIDGSDPMDYSSVDIIAKRQFTGLTDKNGVEIYEGDILQPSSYTKSEFARCTVVFKKGMFCFDISKPFITSTSPLSASLSRGKSASNGFVVIGNIYQNPELNTN